MDSLNSHLSPALQDNQKITNTQPLSTGRFGLPKSSLASKITPLQTEIPSFGGASVKEEINFKAKPAAEQKTVTAIFNKTYLNLKEEEKPSFGLKTKPGDVLIEKPLNGQSKVEKKQNSQASLNGTPRGKEKETNDIALKTVGKTIVKEANQVDFLNINKEVEKGDLLVIVINPKTKQAEISKLDNHDLTNKNNILLRKNGQVVFTSPEQKEKYQDINNYQLVSKDPSIEAKIPNIQANFSSSNPLILTKEQLQTLNNTHKKRLAAIKKEEELKNQKEEVIDNGEQNSENNYTPNQITLAASNPNQTKQRTDFNKLPPTLGGYRTLAGFENMKNQKAQMEEYKEVRQEKKKESERLAAKTNNEKIDERVQERLKEKIEKEPEKNS